MFSVPGASVIVPFLPMRPVQILAKQARPAAARRPPCCLGVCLAIATCRLAAASRVRVRADRFRVRAI
jgi:hypothetical protein